MNINYNVDHKLFALPIFKEKMTNTMRFALWITLSQIVHFCKHSKSKSCEFKQRQMATDFNIRQDFFSKSLKLLQEHKYIKCIKQYDRKTLQAAVYQWDTGYISLRQNLYPSENKPVSQGDTVNNNNNNKAKSDDSTNVSSSSSKWKNTSTGPRRKMTREEQIALIEKTRERTARMQEEQQSQK